MLLPTLTYTVTVRIDPHTHSACSDGTDSPAGLMAQAARAGLDVVGLTDHDTTAGWEEAARAVPDTGVALLRGTEISCATDGVTLHLLSYLHRADDAGLEAAFARARRSRDSRAQRMVERLSEDFPITWEDVLSQCADSHTIGRPHIADALVAVVHLQGRQAGLGHLGEGLIGHEAALARGGARVGRHRDSVSYTHLTLPTTPYV